LRHSLKTVTRAGFAALALGLGVTLVTATAASAATAVGHPNTIAWDVANTSNVLSGSNLATSTILDMNPPVGGPNNVTQCSFAGTTGETFVSFLVPENTNLSTLTFTTFAGQADQGTGVPLSSTAFPSQTPAGNTPPGGIPASYLHSVQFSQLLNLGITVQGTQLPGGSALIPTGSNSAQYEAGIACVAGAGNTGGFTANQITDFWAIPVIFTINGQGGCVDSTDGFCFTPVQPSPPQVAESPLAIGLPIGGAAVFAGAIFINRRRRHPKMVTAA
jgi:hypothetical protein